jgi:fructokinase
MIRIGFDIGGSKVAALALDPQGRELTRLRRDVPRDYGATLAALVEICEGLQHGHGRARSIGIAMPGLIGADGALIRMVNLPWVESRPLRRDLQHALECPVAIANDANCFALSEAIDGAAAGARVVFGATLGTGVGGGIVVGRKVLAGASGIAGEWGHNPLPWMRADEFPGPPCYCGKHGCIETFLSGPGLARDHQQATGQVLDGPNIVARAVAGDPAAAATLSRYEERMARALASVLNVLDPDVVVLGGGLSQIGRLYENVPRLWGRYAFSDSISTGLVPPRHGDASGVRGAAWLWPAA